MKPDRFEYHRPPDVGSAVRLLADLSDEDPKIIAGGQSLVPMMNLRLARPSHLVDIGRIGGLRHIDVVDDRCRIGALTTHTDVLRSERLRRRVPLLPAVAAVIGYQQIRNRGTVGGSLCHADPVAEWPMTMLLLEAEFEITGPRGRRVLPARDFFASLFTTALEPDEMLTGVGFALPAQGWGWGFSEFARKAREFAVVAVTALVHVADGHVAQARLALAGAGSTPVRVPQAERRLVGAAPDESAVEAAVGALAETVDPPGDLHASAPYRRQLLAVEARRALNQAIERASR